VLELSRQRRRVCREEGGTVPSTRLIDALLDERHELTEWATSNSVNCRQAGRAILGISGTPYRMHATGRTDGSCW
jgi:hypothetical protein